MHVQEKRAIARVLFERLQARPTASPSHAQSNVQPQCKRHRKRHRKASQGIARGIARHRKASQGIARHRKACGSRHAARPVRRRGRTASSTQRQRKRGQRVHQPGNGTGPLPVGSQVPAVLFAPSAVLSLYAAGSLTGIVLEAPSPPPCHPFPSRARMCTHANLRPPPQASQRTVAGVPACHQRNIRRAAHV
jgi:hypothetical protein